MAKLPPMSSIRLRMLLSPFLDRAALSSMPAKPRPLSSISNTKAAGSSLGAFGAEVARRLQPIELPLTLLLAH
jgi:hypothetical protein